MGLSKGGRWEMEPLLLRAGLAVAISLASYFFSRSGFARLQPPGDVDGSRQEGGGVLLQEEPKIDEDEEHSSKSVAVDQGPSAVGTVSPLSKSSGDDEGYLLPEFNELVRNEFEIAVKELDTAVARKESETAVGGLDTPVACASTPKKIEQKDLSAMGGEIANMKNLVHSLREREEELEFQLLECYALKEQQSTASELKNRLKINSVETKALSMKVESLQANNQKLEAQLSNNSGVEAELDNAKEKIKFLERKMISDSEQARETMAALHERISALQAKGEDRREKDEELKQALMRLKDLEDEAVNLRNENSKLATVNLDLTEKLESGPASASSQTNSEETEVLEEGNRLRQQNKELLKEIDQLRIDMSADVGELVYLRWLTACLRYELRDYQHPEGRTLARELGKSLSPKSEEKAKHLILEYANSGSNDNLVVDYDSGCCSSSPSSWLTESGDFDDSSVGTNNSCSSSKTKFFRKLKKFVLGKDAHGKRSSPSDRTHRTSGNLERGASISHYSSDDMFARVSFDSLTSCMAVEHNPISLRQLMSLDSKSEEHSLEEAGVRMYKRCKSDSGYSRGPRRSILGTQRSSSHHIVHADVGSGEHPEKEELKKFAEALMNTSWSPQFRRKSVTLA